MPVIIDKLIISQSYNFSTLPYYSKFSIDFANKRAFHDYIPFDYEISEEFNKSISSLENYNVNKRFKDDCIYKTFLLSSQKIIEFQNDFEKLNLFEDFKPVIDRNWFDDKFQDIDNLNEFFIEIYYDDGSQMKFEIVNEYPRRWFEFGEMLRDLLEFDLLNIANSKYLVTELYFDIKKDGAYLNGKKLRLSKMYYYHEPTFGIRNYSWCIDFNNKTLNSSRNYSFPDSFLNLNERDLDKILSMIDKYGVYLWYHKDYFNRMGTDKFPKIIFDGTHWYIELVFEDEYVLHFGGHEEYPDTFVHFGEDIRNLLGRDLFEISGFNDDEKNEYYKWGNKLL